MKKLISFSALLVMTLLFGSLQPALAADSKKEPVRVTAPSKESVAQKLASHEPWKGTPDPSIVDFSGMAGLGVLDSSGGFTVIGSAARKIADDGFVPDINNTVWMEVQAGPLFVNSSTALFYSTHLRWDFGKDETWTLYAIGGVGGHITGQALGSRFLLFPRVGLGARMRLNERMVVRAEYSHELMAVGLSFPFY